MILHVWKWVVFVGDQRSLENTALGVVIGKNIYIPLMALAQDLAEKIGALRQEKK